MLIKISTSLTLSMLSSIAYANTSEYDGGSYEVCEPEYPVDPQDMEKICEDADRYYHHPFQGVEKIQGMIPLLERKNSPEGKRYAVGESAQIDEIGTIDVHSGIIELDRRKITKLERDEMISEKTHGRIDKWTPDSSQAPQVEKIGPRLHQVLSTQSDDGDPEHLYPVRLHIRRGTLATIQHRMALEIAKGHIDTESSAMRIAEQVRIERQEEIRNITQPTVDAINSMSAKVTYRCRNATCLNANLTNSQIEQIAERPEVDRMDLHYETTKNIDIDGKSLADDNQYRQFWDLNYDGNNGSSTDITFAVIDTDGYRNTHVGYKEGSGSSTRIRNMYKCTDSGCNSTNGWPSSEHDDHATRVAGTVFQDYTDSQSTQSGSGAERRSAAAREARGYLYDIDTFSGSDGIETARQAFDHIGDRSRKPELVAYSLGSESADTSCLGQDDRSIDVNELLFENSIGLFFAAGNEGAPSGDCTVESPGSAIGAFTVGGYGSEFDENDLCAIRNRTINSNSAQGGVNTGTGTTTGEGADRSIIDIAGSYTQRRRTNINSNTHLSDFDGTSHAAPSVAGSALNFIDMYKNERSNFIDDPGVLYTWMLINGDRQGVSSKISTHFDNRYGAGRLRLRMLNGEGLDGPAYFGGSWTCVDDDEVVRYDLNDGLPLTSATDRIKVVIWWYDPNHQDGNLDDIDLRLEVDGSIKKNSNSFRDNKEMVMWSSVNSSEVSFEIVGWDVTADNAGCGTNSMKVYWAFIAEDNARNDTDGPSYNWSTCEGVELL